MTERRATSRALLALLLALPATAAADGRTHSAGERHDYCIIGAGPAGLQLAHLLETVPSGARDYVVFDQAAAPGSFFATYPRHRKLISINKRHTGKTNGDFNMRHDWNSLLPRRANASLAFKNFDRKYFPHADSMVDYLQVRAPPPCRRRAPTPHSIQPTAAPPPRPAAAPHHCAPPPPTTQSVAKRPDGGPPVVLGRGGRAAHPARD